mmetsp:Transcript_19416/g.63281  ORF Transcript_19416/g.63281 Transcript_19416/m.63281 type:complete len:202 (+) Transcript_19416:373-978(+)|eukprot:scaffold18728_cov121-Isochrysis_galbana.AAC.6
MPPAPTHRHSHRSNSSAEARPRHPARPSPARAGLPRSAWTQDWAQASPACRHGWAQASQDLGRRPTSACLACRALSRWKCGRCYGVRRSAERPLSRCTVLRSRRVDQPARRAAPRSQAAPAAAPPATPCRRRPKARTGGRCGPSGGAARSGGRCVCGCGRQSHPEMERRPVLLLCRRKRPPSMRAAGGSARTTAPATCAAP